MNKLVVAPQVTAEKPLLTEYTPVTTPSCKSYRKLVDAASFGNHGGNYAYWRSEGYTADEIELVKVCVIEMQEALQPSDDRFLAGVMASMRTRYGNSFTWKDLSSEQLVHLAREWVADLKEYPADLVEEAYRLWRQGKRGGGKDGTRKGEPPRDVGELMSVVSKPLQGRRTYLSKAQGILEYVRIKGGVA